MMKTKASYLTSTILGIIFGILANYSVLAGSWYNLIIWGVVGILIGLFIYEKRLVRSAGLTYGVFVTAAFLISGFQGTSDKLLGFALLTLVLSLVGALCGWELVYIGYWMKGSKTRE